MTLGAMGQGAGNGLKYLSVSIFRTRYFKSAHNTKCWFCVKTTRNYLNFVRLALCAHKLPIRPRHCLTGFETFPAPCYGFPHNLENFLWGFTLNFEKSGGFACRRETAPAISISRFCRCLRRFPDSSITPNFFKI